jgi:hypothetical protein
MKKYVKAAVKALSEEDPQALVSIIQAADNSEVLEELLQNPRLSWVLKLAIIENANVTDDILKRLSNDSNSTVSQAARYRMNERKYR